MAHVYIAQVKFPTATSMVGELRLKYLNRIQKIYIRSTDMLPCRVRMGIVLYCNGLKVPGCVNPALPSSKKYVLYMKKKKRLRGYVAVAKVVVR